MTLDQFLRRNKIPAKYLAAKLNRSPAWVTLVRKKQTVPPLVEILKIMKVTNYQVLPCELLPDKALKELGITGEFLKPAIL